MVYYYIIDAGDVAVALPFMEAALGTPNVSARYSIDDPATKAIMKFDDGNLPPITVGVPYTNGQIRQVINSSTLWTELPEPVTGDARVSIDREYGLNILTDLMATVRQEWIDGNINTTQYTSHRASDITSNIACNTTNRSCNTTYRTSDCTY